MGRQFALYWSNIEKYEACNRSFFWKRGWAGFDLGRGDGRGMKIPVQKSEHHALMGQVIQRAIEDLYNKELWKQFRGAEGKYNWKELRKELDRLTRFYFDKKLAKRYVEFGNRFNQAGTREELLGTCLKGVRGYIKTMRANRFLGEYNQAETDWRTVIEHGVHIGGKADLLIRRRKDAKVLPGVTILDGKNSKHKGRYTDPDQVRFYALCFYLIYGVLPDRLGFVYYRFPYGTPVEDGGPDDIEQGVDWVEFTEEDLDGLAHRAVKCVRGMEAHQFDPNPQPSNCRWCDFETVCPERVAQKAANSAKRKKKSPTLDADLAVADASSSGILEF